MTYSTHGQSFSLPKGVRATVDFLQRIADKINGAELGVTAKVGFTAEMIHRPVTECAAYVLLEKLSFGNAEFSVTVYSPLKLEGRGCIEKAQSVCRVISEGDSSYCTQNLTVGQVRYNNSSNAFTVKISGTAESKFPYFGGVSVRAFNFKEASDKSVEFTAESVRIEHDCLPYLIKTICSSKPLDAVQGEENRTITFNSVEPNTADKLIGCGVFSLEVKSGEDIKIFTDCYCVKQINDKLVIGN